MSGHHQLNNRTAWLNQKKPEGGHAGAKDGCIPVTKRELAKPYADHVENVTVRKGNPFKRTETHQKSEKE
jgi:hypothetical protein